MSTQARPGESIWNTRLFTAPSIAPRSPRFITRSLIFASATWFSLSVDQERVFFARRNCNAAVFFTGGSTGSPKAVPHTHRALLWHAAKSLEFIVATGVLKHGCTGTICFTPYFHVMGFVVRVDAELDAGPFGS